MSLKSRCFAVLLLGVAALSLNVAVSQAGTYKVRDCKNMTTSLPTWPAGLLTSMRNTYSMSSGVVPQYISNSTTNGFAYENTCGYTGIGWGHGRMIFAYSGTYKVNDVAKVKYVAPYGAGFTSLQAYTEMGANNPPKTLSRMIFHDEGSNALVVPTTGSFVNYTVPSSGNRRVFEFQIKCMQAGCTPSGWAKMDDLAFEVNDYTSPDAWIGGNLFYSGTVSGTRTFDGFASDGQSGIRSMSLYVNGTLHSSKAGTCAPTLADGSYLVLKPCNDASLAWNTTVNTALPPFVNGKNTVKVCAWDGSGAGACDQGDTYVSN